jgi:Ca2+-binding RTX toxin-like protein
MLERLENRRLFSITSPLPGVVYVYGSNAADNISVTGSGTSISIAGDAGSAAFANVGIVYIFGRGGDDTVAVADAITSTAVINGGAGRDNLTGGGGNDQISGDDGNDVLHGGSGRDQLIGGAGSDHLYGDAGFDSLNARGDKATDWLHADSSDIMFIDKKDVIV